LICCHNVGRNNLGTLVAHCQPVCYRTDEHGDDEDECDQPTAAAGQGTIRFALRREAAGGLSQMRCVAPLFPQNRSPPCAFDAAAPARSLTVHILESAGDSHAGLLTGRRINPPKARDKLDPANSLEAM
jgi:hypothetical protein